MFPTQLYQSTLNNILTGVFKFDDEYLVNLYLDSHFVQTAETKSQAEENSITTPDANGYLANKKVTKFTTKVFDRSVAWVPNPISWRVTDATISANSAIFFHKPTNKPFIHVNFGQLRTANKSNNFTFQFDDLGLLFFNIPG